MKTLEALNNGKIIKFKSNEPRYYKKEHGRVLHSDNLVDWRISSAKESAFKDDNKWKIIE